MGHPVAVHSVGADIGADDGFEQAYALLVCKNRSCRGLAICFHCERHHIAAGRVKNVGVRKHVVANFTCIEKLAGIRPELPNSGDVAVRHKAATYQTGFAIVKKAENAIIAGNNCLRSEEERYAPNQAISAGRYCCRSSGGGCRLWNLCPTGLSIETCRLSSTHRDSTFTGFAGNEWRDVCGTDRLSAGTEHAAAFGFRRPKSSAHERCGPVSAAHHSRYVSNVQRHWCGHQFE